MKKVVGIVIVLLILTVAALSYQRHRTAVRNQGTVIPWQPVEFTYKDYNGKPGIDDPEFYEIVKQKTKNGECRRLLSKYINYPISKLEKLAETNTDAMFELFVRTKEDHYISKAHELGHMNSLLVITMLDGRMERISKEDAFKVFDRYEKITPLALFCRAMLMHHFHLDNSVEIQELKKVGNYNFILAASVKLEFLNTGNVDREVFCEAYFRGCDMYAFKNEEKIKCKEN